MNTKKSNYKTTLWSSFGDILVENLKRNLQRKYGEKNIQCDGCGERIEAVSNRKKYCNVCWREKERQLKRKSWHKNKSKYKNTRSLEKTLQTLDT
ncbi:hypothetical protein BAG01nite_12930 [Brevibacillus agri]|uniref:Uncharacterized protein n=1 Tax=Brevibacillus agri TaxID=51101 RepID=A0ABQ0SMY5_9BACL|nr:hypothetical protein [Brevibacillus agri]GED25191.1 hypothetical protein BAG01nite_12930 [Brevibacillus agri]